MEQTDLSKEPNKRSKEAQKKSGPLGVKEESTDFDRRFGSVTSYDFNYLFKNIAKPNFLGSIHLKNNTMDYNVQPVKDLLYNQRELELTKSLRNTMFNPITKFLILIAIIFNITWILLLYL